jgi:hypothetical protein
MSVRSVRATPARRHRPQCLHQVDHDSIAQTGFSAAKFDEAIARRIIELSADRGIHPQSCCARDCEIPVRLVMIDIKYYIADYHKSCYDRTRSGCRVRTHNWTAPPVADPAGDMTDRRFTEDHDGAPGPHRLGGPPRPIGQSTPDHDGGEGSKTPCVQSINSGALQIGGHSRSASR